MNMGKCEIVLVVFCILFYPSPTSPQPRTEPVNVGLIVALPWDVSNTLRAPFGGPVAIALSVIMAGILLFGLLLAPVNYILGYPSRIYHPSRNPGLIETKIYQKTREKFNKTLGRSLEEEDIFVISSAEGVPDFGFIENSETANSGDYPDFQSSAFYFIPEEDLDCRKLILCHAHRFLRIFPKRFKKFLRLFSKRSLGIKDEYKDAVLLGLGSQSECTLTYKCSKDLTAILKEVLYSFLSSDMKALWKLRKLF